MESLRLKAPFTALICGPTSCGKTHFLRNFLKYHTQLIFPKIDTIVWFYGIYQDLYDEIPNVTFVEGIPENFNNYLGKNTLFILDDLMSECGNNKRITDLYTRGSHHMNISIITVSQNIFHKGKEFREISLNSHYLFLFKSRRDVSQISHLGRQLYPRNLKFFLEVFEDATKKPYSYLMVDLKPETEENLRLRTKILPGEEMCVYQMK
nr:TPA_asm: FtsK [Parasteatoda house spider adintovirus]